MYATSYMHVIISAIRNSIEILENDNLGSEVSTLQKKKKKKKKKKKIKQQTNKQKKKNKKKKKKKQKNKKNTPLLQA